LEEKKRMQINTPGQGRSLSTLELSGIKGQSPSGFIPLKDSRLLKIENNAGPISGEGGKVSPVPI
jgi:hypothetical protein